MQSPIEYREPWTIPCSELVPLAQTYPISVVHDDGPQSYCEADLHAYSISYRRREIAPPSIPAFPVGTWSIDSMQGLWQLCQYALRDSQLWFQPQNNPYATQNERGYFSDVWPWVVEKYVAWLQEGHEPPPLRGIETRDGSIRVTDGNNRAAALAHVDRHETFIWVSLAITLPSGFCTSLTHQQAVTDALRVGLPVPAAVLAEYPELLPSLKNTP